MVQGSEFMAFVGTDPRTTVAVLLITSFNALAYNVVHYKMIAVSLHSRLCVLLIQTSLSLHVLMRRYLHADDISSHHDSHWGGEDHWIDGAVSSAARYDSDLIVRVVQDAADAAIRTCMTFGSRTICTLFRGR